MNVISVALWNILIVEKKNKIVEKQIGVMFGLTCYLSMTAFSLQEPLCFHCKDSGMRKGNLLRKCIFLITPISYKI